MLVSSVCVFRKTNQLGLLGMCGRGRIIAAEVSRHKCSKSGELAVEGDSGPVHQTIDSEVLPFGTVFGLSPRARSLEERLWLQTWYFLFF